MNMDAEREAFERWVLKRSDYGETYHPRSSWEAWIARAAAAEQECERLNAIASDLQALCDKQALALSRAPAEHGAGRCREALTRPIVGIENRTAQEVFDIMVGRFRRAVVDAEALRSAERLANALQSKHYPEHTRWAPLSGDMLGLLSQIDNMTTGLSRTAPPPPVQGEVKVKPLGWVSQRGLDNIADEERNGGCPVSHHVWGSFTIPVYLQPAPAPPVPGEVRVKPLEWCGRTGGIYFSATSLVGTYTAHKGGRWFAYLEGKSFGATAFETREAAQAACRADYERRIRSALVEPAPAPAGVNAIEVATENVRSAWISLRMIRECVETLGPVGAMQSGEAVSCLTAPTFEAEEEEIIVGIQKIAGVNAAPTFHGMATGLVTAAVILMRAFGHETCAREILNAGGLRSLDDLREVGADDYDIDALRPLFPVLSKQGEG